MQKKIKTYYYFLLGSFGGVTGWFILSFFPEINNISNEILVVFSVRGLILGGIIGLSLAAYEGISNSSTIRFLRYGFIGLIVGSIGGAIALPLAQFLYNLFISSVGSNSKPDPLYVFGFGLFCWLIFGGVIGFIEGWGKGSQLRYGFFGGAIGGLVGGLIYEIARFSGGFANEAQFTLDDYVIQAMSFLLLGGIIGAALSLITNLFTSAEIKILTGDFAGDTRNISKFVMPNSQQSGSIGSNSAYDHVFIKKDPYIIGQHAILCYEDNGPRIKISEGAKKAKKEVMVNGRPISSWALVNKDIIQIGSTQMQYLEYK
jgi:FHA domain